MKSNSSRPSEKVILNIGNWSVTSKGISWEDGRYYYIDKDDLWDRRAGENIYDWLIHLVEKTRYHQVSGLVN